MSVGLEMSVPLNESEVPRRARAKYLRPLLGWFLLLMVTSAQIVATSYLSYYFLREKLQNATDQPRRSLTKCVTHWTGSRISNQEQHETEMPLAWKTDKGQVFTGDCTEYRENSLEIKKSGYYFIYLQVMFHKNENNVKLVMEINGEEIIRNSQKAMGIDYKTVFFGSTYKLRNGTKIVVKSNPKDILYGESETFIGLFEL